MTRKKIILIHCHIFKNAGTSLDWALEKNFHKAFLDHRDDEAMRSDSNYLREFINNHPEYVVISSHHVRLPLPIIDGTIIEPMVMLRDPVDRAGSVYAFEKQQVSDTPGAKMAKVMNFEEYIKWRMQPDTGATIRNYQVLTCAGKTWKSSWQVGKDDLDSSMRFIEDTSLTGIVEMYDESMVLYEEYLRDYFPAINLAYIPQNIGDRRGTYEQRRNKIRDNLSEETYELLLENNKYDEMLHVSAKELLLDRMSRIQNFKYKLNAFRARCKALTV